MSPSQRGKRKQVYVADGYKVLIVRNRASEYVIKSSNDAYEYVKNTYKHAGREQFGVILLDTAMQIINFHILTTGSIDCSIVNIREVMQCLISSEASRFIAVHNHPSGNTEPSKEDIMITKKLSEASNLFSIVMMDHIIVGRNGFQSIIKFVS